MIKTGTKVTLLTNISDSNNVIRINVGTVFTWNAEAEFQTVGEFNCSLEESDVQEFVSPLEDLEPFEDLEELIGEPLEDYIPDDDYRLINEALEAGGDRPPIPPLEIVSTPANQENSFKKLMEIVNNSDYSVGQGKSQKPLKAVSSEVLPQFAAIEPVEQPSRTGKAGKFALPSPVAKKVTPRVQVKISPDRSWFKIINSENHHLDLEVRKTLKKLGWDLQNEEGNAYRVSFDNVDEDCLERSAYVVMLCYLTGELLI